VNVWRPDINLWAADINVWRADINLWAADINVWRPDINLCFSVFDGLCNRKFTETRAPFFDLAGISYRRVFNANSARQPLLTHTPLGSEPQERLTLQRLRLISRVRRTPKRASARQ
jgi:hypothetical protein